eukprot:scaffold7386_cov509-Prasinococcus_capsulatus_cf.AAC.8
MISTRPVGARDGLHFDRPGGLACRWGWSGRPSSRRRCWSPSSAALIRSSRPQLPQRCKLVQRYGLAPGSHEISPGVGIKFSNVPRRSPLAGPAET